MRALLLLVAVIAFQAGACGGDLDPPWQLDHDRIIAVRAEAPGLAANETTQLTGLLAVKGGPTEERPPDAAILVSPKSLMGAVSLSGVVTAPDEATLAQVRTELGIADGMPVPLQIGVCFAGAACFDADNKLLVGIKGVSLGTAQANPTMPAVSIADAPAPAPETQLTVATMPDVALHVDAAEEDDVNWLTSAGTMHDDDLPTARISFEEDDPLEGELVLVLRDDHGGVTWQTWPLVAQ